MTEAYDPLKDPASDGYANVELSKTDWKAGKTEPAVFDNPTFVKWFKRGAWLFLVVLIFVVGTLAWKANQDHKAEVAKIEAAPVALPELVKPTIVKRIAKKIAPQAVNTPPIVEFGSTVQKPTEPLSQFEVDVIAFETKVKKDFP